VFLDPLRVQQKSAFKPDLPAGNPGGKTFARFPKMLNPLLKSSVLGSSPGHFFISFKCIMSLYKCHFEYRKTRTSVWHYRGSGYRARTQTLAATPLISGLDRGALVTNAAPCADLPRAWMAHVFDLML